MGGGLVLDSKFTPMCLLHVPELSVGSKRDLAQPHPGSFSPFMPCDDLSSSTLAMWENWQLACTVHCSLLFTAPVLKGFTDLQQTRKKKTASKQVQRVNITSPINHLGAAPSRGLDADPWSPPISVQQNCLRCLLAETVAKGLSPSLFQLFRTECSRAGPARLCVLQLKGCWSFAAPNAAATALAWDRLGFSLSFPCRKP